MTRPNDDREVPEDPGTEDDVRATGHGFEPPLEAEPADAFEQAQEVPGDEDDYRA